MDPAIQPASSDDRLRPRPSPLRLWGFLVTILGGTLIGVGSILTWAEVDFGGISVTKGIDTLEGKVALGASILVLIGIPAMRGALSRPGRRAWAIIIVVASLVAGGLTLYALGQKQERLGIGSAENLARDIAAQSGIAETEVLEQVRGEVIVEVQPGLYITIAGAALGVAGGILGLAWAARAPLPGGDADRDAGEAARGDAGEADARPPGEDERRDPSSPT